MNRFLALGTLCLLVTPVAMADARLQLPDFSALAAHATEHTDISLDGELLGLASAMAAKGDGSAGRHRASRLERIDVHSFEFDHDHAYDGEAVERIRAQLHAPNWRRLVQTHSDAEREDVDIFVSVEHDEPTGLAIIVTEPRQLTVVNIVGHINLQELVHDAGPLGLPPSAAEALRREAPGSAAD